MLAPHEHDAFFREYHTCQRAIDRTQAVISEVTPSLMSAGVDPDVRGPALDALNGLIEQMQERMAQLAEILDAHDAEAERVAGCEGRTAA